MFRDSKHLRWLIGATALLALLLVVSGRALWQANQAIHDAALSYDAESSLPFTTRPVVRQVSPDVEWIMGAATYHDAALFESHFYLASSFGIDRFNEQGALVARYFAGRDLPPSRIIQVTAGIQPGGGEPVLLVTTEAAGLLLFNGKEFRQMQPENPALAKLTAVLPGAGGRILLGTQSQGVLLFDGHTLRPFHSSLSGFHVTALEGAESDLWVGTLDNGVIHWASGISRQFTEADGLPDRRVLSIAADAETAYVGTALGVAEIQGGQITRKLAEGFFSQHLLRDEETLLVGTLNEGTIEIPLSQRKPRALRMVRHSDSGVQGRLLSLSDSLYAISNAGLYHRDARTSEWQRVIEPEGDRLSDTNISALSVEPDGTLWVGYFDRGLDIIEPNGAAPRHLEDENLFCINRIVRHPDRTATAVATANGLALFDGNRRLRRVLGRKDGLIANHVTDVLLYDDGMTVATPAGLTLMDGSGQRSLYAFHGLVSNHAYTLASANNQLLVGTLGGLSFLDDGRVQASFTTANSDLPHNWITAAERVGDEWFVGTYGAGILRQDTSGRWHSFADLPAGLEINPNALLVTRDHVYAGTLGEGLYVYSRDSRRWSLLQASFPSNNVTALAEHDGYLYVGTDNGMVRIRERGSSQ